MKCVIPSDYSQKNIDEMPDLLAMIFPGSKIAGNIILGRVKLGDVIKGLFTTRISSRGEFRPGLNSTLCVVKPLPVFTTKKLKKKFAPG